MKKTIFFIVILFMLCNNIYICAAEKPFFTDVPNNHYAINNIEKLVNLGIINGYEDGTFKPDSNINVDAFIKLAITSIGFPNIKNADGYWATNYINKAIELSIIEQNQFDTYKRSITREEMASISSKALGYIEDKDNIENNFLFIKNCISDFYNISDRYLQDVVESYYYGLVTGNGHGFDPKSNATRADAVTSISRLLDKNLRKPIIIPPVVTESDIKKDEGNKMYFDFARYNNQKSIKKSICRISECPNGEHTALQLLYAMDEVCKNTEGYVYLQQLGEDDHPIGIRYDCMGNVNASHGLIDSTDESEVTFRVKHSKHDTISAYNISLDHRINDMSYIDRYYKYQEMFETMLLYLYDDKFPIIKENFIEILTLSDNTHVDTYSYTINLNDREMYIVNTKNQNLSIDITIKGGKIEHLNTDESSEQGQINKLAPDFSLKNLDGKTHRLKDYKGKKVYIQFWSSWCPHCISGLSEINSLFPQERDFVVLTIVSPGYKKEKSKGEFIDWFNGLDYKNMNVLLDIDGEIARSYGITAYPTSVYISEDGLIAKKVSGHNTNSDIVKVFSDME